MVVIDALTFEYLEPRCGLDVFASVFVPADVELGLPVVAQDFGGSEGADVQANAIVQVRVPADGLFREGLPADEDVVGCFTFQDEFQLTLEGLGSGQALRGTVGAVGHAGFLGANPVTKVGVNETLKVLGVEIVVIHERTEAVLQAVPDVPDERAVVEALGVLLEELLAQPHI